MQKRIIPSSNAVVNPCSMSISLSSNESLLSVFCIRYLLPGEAHEMADDAAKIGSGGDDAAAINAFILDDPVEFEIDDEEPDLCIGVVVVAFASKE